MLSTVTVVLNAIAESDFPVNAVAVCAVLADARVLLLCMQIQRLFLTFWLFTVTQKWNHRISTSRKEKVGERPFFHQDDPNWPLPYSTVPVPRLRDGRLAGWVTYCSIICEYTTESLKQGRKRFNSIAKTKYIADLVIIYLCVKPCSFHKDPILLKKLTMSLTLNLPFFGWVTEEKIKYYDFNGGPTKITHVSNLSHLWVKKYSRHIISPTFFALQHV